MTRTSAMAQTYAAATAWLRVRNDEKLVFKGHIKAQVWDGLNALIDHNSPLSARTLNYSFSTSVCSGNNICWVHHHYEFFYLTHYWIPPWIPTTRSPGKEDIFEVPLWRWSIAGTISPSPTWRASAKTINYQLYRCFARWSLPCWAPTVRTLRKGYMCYIFGPQRL